MMFWYDHNVGGWGWFAMSAGMILFWALIVTVAVLLFRAVNRPQERTHSQAARSAEDILRERLARGDIEDDEYRRRLNTLHASPLTKP
ncbi:SHOCT domain-containing protein [Streptomyces kunmingensis]|uniref:SHOCT domain-containing protein n=1 Tax=Streptomyces kunmingensis TaxID=68225 RepID=A0ABU6CQW4_9ACTN|nr:SHOCT domain-containing protein [Streptomyces kunmingensis]MEB3967150.1 SHOCT domain-containing protein [Streptomyces kunmingensis]